MWVEEANGTGAHGGVTNGISGAGNERDAGICICRQIVVVCSCSYNNHARIKISANTRISNGTRIGASRSSIGDKRIKRGISTSQSKIKSRIKSRVRIIISKNMVIIIKGRF